MHTHAACAGSHQQARIAAPARVLGPMQCTSGGVKRTVIDFCAFGDGRTEKNLIFSGGDDGATHSLQQCPPLPHLQLCVSSRK